MSQPATKKCKRPSSEEEEITSYWQLLPLEIQEIIIKFARFLALDEEIKNKIPLAVPSLVRGRLIKLGSLGWSRDVLHEMMHQHQYEWGTVFGDHPAILQLLYRRERLVIDYEHKSFMMEQPLYFDRAYLAVHGYCTQQPLALAKETTNLFPFRASYFCWYNDDLGPLEWHGLSHETVAAYYDKRADFHKKYEILLRDIENQRKLTEFFPYECKIELK